MSRVVQCVFLKQEAPGLDRPPYPGDLGKRIYENVSKEAWARWLKQQTMLINEYRLSPIEPKARKFLEGEMEKFFLAQARTYRKGFNRPRAESRKGWERWNSPQQNFTWAVGINCVIRTSIPTL
jgi:Fe-S cluster biosynthesis and repair protein YggX